MQNQILGRLKDAQGYLYLSLGEYILITIRLVDPHEILQTNCNKTFLMVLNYQHLTKGFHT